MDLSPTPFDRAAEVRPPAELAVLMVGVAARQAASVTAGVQAEIGRTVPDPTPFAPSDGRFSASAADAVAGWGEG